jgi:hypothetical protein
VNINRKSTGRCILWFFLRSKTTSSNSKEQVTQTIYDTLDRAIQVKLGVSGDTAANSHNMGSSYTTYPTLQTVSASIYDGDGAGDGYVTKVKRYFGSGANDFTGVEYWYNFRGQLRGDTAAGAGAWKYATRPTPGKSREIQTVYIAAHIPKSRRSTLLRTISDFGRRRWSAPGKQIGARRTDLADFA